jgi:hypothetical protein
MNYREFIERVSAKGGLDREEVRDMFRRLPGDMLALFSIGAGGRTA